MTVNPMQRRTRNSFILGFGVAVLVALVIIVALVVGMRNTNAKLKAEKAKQRMLLVSNVDINDYSEVNSTNTVLENTIVSLSEAEVATLADLELEGRKILSKTRIPKGTVITKSMLISEEEKDAHDLRLYELNMVMIPSRLETGAVIDVRLTMPRGQDFIVLSKKIVEKADNDSIWIKLREDEILTFNNAMVEAYLVQGTKLYVAPYINPGIQKAAAQTYPLSSDVWELIKSDTNITEMAKNALAARHNKTVGLRQTIINPEITKALSANGIERVYEGVKEEISNMNTKREKYLEELMQPTV